jgi:ribonucleoside-triphosphate reductase
LIGSHHGETEEARKLGYEIVSHMREMTDKFADETDLNFSLFCTPEFGGSLYRNI